jgi:IS5 family transposase
MVMFRMLVLRSLYNLSDEQVEYQVRDRRSFTRFLRLGIEDGIPDGTTLRLFRETLAKAGLVEKLFERFGLRVAARWLMPRPYRFPNNAIAATRLTTNPDPEGRARPSWSPTDHTPHFRKSLFAGDPVIGAIRFTSARQGSHSHLRRQPHVNERFLGCCN